MANSDMKTSIFTPLKLRNHNKYNNEDSWPYYPKDYITYPSASKYILLNNKVKQVFNKQIEEGAANNVNSSEKVPSSQYAIGNMNGETSKAFADIQNKGSSNTVGVESKVLDINKRMDEIENKLNSDSPKSKNDIEDNKIKSISSTVKSALQKMSKEAKSLITKLYPDLSEQPALMSKGSNIRKEAELLGKVAVKTVDGLDSTTKSV